MKKLHVLTTLLLAMVLLLSCGTEALAGETLKVQVQAESRVSDARNMLTLINQLRTGKNAWYWSKDNKPKVKVKGLKKLQYDYTLERVAMQRALEIAVYFNHTRPDGSSWSSAFPGGYSARGENIAYGYGSAKSAFNALAEKDKKYKGQGHRRNMLSKDYTRVGIGAVKVGNVVYWVQSFGAGKSGSSGKSNGWKADKVKASTELLLGSSRGLAPELEQLSVTEGESVSLPRVVIYSNSGARLFLSDCSWKSRDKQVASVKSKKVTGAGIGNTVLDTEIGSKKVSLPVQVVAKAQSETISEMIDDYDPALIAEEYLVVLEDDECFMAGE